MQLNPYLFFNGNCSEALELYRQCLGAKVVHKMTYGEAPMADQFPPELHGRVLHFQMEIDGKPVMGADAPPPHYHQPAGFCVTVSVDEVASAERIFAGLSEGGTVREAMTETFFADRFGMAVDRFGIPWMVICPKPM